MMSFTDRSSHRRNNANRRSSLALVPEDPSSALLAHATFSTPTAAGPSGRRKKSRSPASTRTRTDSSTITTAVGLGKKRKSAASSLSGTTNSIYGPDDMVVDRGRNLKPKSKAKTQSWHATENSASAAVEQPPLQSHSHRHSKKERSKSRDSKERSRKHPLSETSASGEKSVNGQSGAHSDSAGSFSTTELIRVRKELEALKKVCSILSY